MRDLIKYKMEELDKYQNMNPRTNSLNNHILYWMDILR